MSTPIGEVLREQGGEGETRVCLQPETRLNLDTAGRGQGRLVGGESLGAEFSAQQMQQQQPPHPRPHQQGRQPPRSLHWPCYSLEALRSPANSPTSKLKAPGLSPKSPHAFHPKSKELSWDIDLGRVAAERSVSGQHSLILPEVEASWVEPFPEDLYGNGDLDHSHNGAARVRTYCASGAQEHMRCALDVGCPSPPLNSSPLSEASDTPPLRSSSGGETQSAPLCAYNGNMASARRSKYSGTKTGWLAAPTTQETVKYQKAQVHIQERSAGEVQKARGDMQRQMSRNAEQGEVAGQRAKAVRGEPQELETTGTEIERMPPVYSHPDGTKAGDFPKALKHSQVLSGDTTRDWLPPGLEPQSSMSAMQNNGGRYARSPSQGMQRNVVCEQRGQDSDCVSAQAQEPTYSKLTGDQPVRHPSMRAVPSLSPLRPIEVELGALSSPPRGVLPRGKSLGVLRPHQRSTDQEFPQSGQTIQYSAHSQQVQGCVVQRDLATWDALARTLRSASQGPLDNNQTPVVTLIRAEQDLIMESISSDVSGHADPPGMCRDHSLISQASALVSTAQHAAHFSSISAQVSSSMGYAVGADSKQTPYQKNFLSGEQRSLKTQQPQHSSSQSSQGSPAHKACQLGTPTPCGCVLRGPTVRSRQGSLCLDQHWPPASSAVHTRAASCHLEQQWKPSTNIERCDSGTLNCSPLPVRFPSHSCQVTSPSSVEANTKAEGLRSCGSRRNIWASYPQARELVLRPGNYPQTGMGLLVESPELAMSFGLGSIKAGSETEEWFSQTEITGAAGTQTPNKGTCSPPADPGAVLEGHQVNGFQECSGRPRVRFQSGVGSPHVRVASTAKADPSRQQQVESALTIIPKCITELPRHETSCSAAYPSHEGLGGSPQTCHHSPQHRPAQRQPLQQNKVCSQLRVSPLIGHTSGVPPTEHPGQGFEYIRRSGGNDSPHSHRTAHGPPSLLKALHGEASVGTPASPSTVTARARILQGHGLGGMEAGGKEIHGINCQRFRLGHEANLEPAEKTCSGLERMQTYRVANVKDSAVERGGIHSPKMAHSSPSLGNCCGNEDTNYGFPAMNKKDSQITSAVQSPQKETRQHTQYAHSSRRVHFSAVVNVRSITYSKQT